MLGFSFEARKGVRFLLPSCLLLDPTPPPPLLLYLHNSQISRSKQINQHQQTKSKMLHRSSSNLSVFSNAEMQPLLKALNSSNDKDTTSSKPQGNAPKKPAASISHSSNKREKVCATKSLFDKKIKPNRLVVDQPDHGADNSVVYLHPAKLMELELFRGDVVLLKGRLHHTTVAIVLEDDTCDTSKVKINRTIRNNLRVRLGDLITLQPRGLDIPFGSRVHILPLEDTIQKINGDLFEIYLKPYFLDAYRPVRKGDYFSVQRAMHTVEVSYGLLSLAALRIIPPHRVIYLQILHFH